MPLKSRALAGDPRLEACLVEDPAHLTKGVKGEFVAKVQAALIYLDGLEISDSELSSQTYGESTAAAVLAYKTLRGMVNYSYQQSPDEIVGRMTIKSLDDELALAESQPLLTKPYPFCVRY